MPDPDDSPIMTRTIWEGWLDRLKQGGLTVWKRLIVLAVALAWVLGGVAGVHAQGGKKVKQTAVITLEKGGEIRIEFFPEDAPKTVYCPSNPGWGPKVM